MIVENIGRLLNRIERFERRLERYYADIRDRSKDNDLRLLTYYLGRHYRHLPDVLKEQPRPIIKSVRRFEIELRTPFTPEKAHPVIQIAPDKVRSQELLAAAIRYDDALVDLYRAILKQRLKDPAQKLFTTLVHVEERDLAMLKRMAAMNYF